MGVGNLWAGYVMPARVVVGGLAGLLVSGIRRDEVSRAGGCCEFNMVGHGSKWHA